MGGSLTKRGKRHSSNKIFDANEAESDEHHQSTSHLEEEEIRVPDKTTKHKSKSISLFAFPKKSFIRKTSSLQPTKNAPDFALSPLEQLKHEKTSLKEEIQRITQRNLEEHQMLNNEITKLKTENKTLMSALRKVRSDKDRALLLEKDAVERANNFELEKEKIQRQFKMFREVKEEELRTLLKEKHKLQNELRRFTGNEGSINEALMESGDFRHARLVNEWLLEGQSGVESLVGQQIEDGKWKQMVENSEKYKEVFKAFKVVLESIQHFGYGVPLSNVYSVYITSTRELKYIADDLMAQCKRLKLQLEPEGKLLTLTYFLTLPETQLDKTEEMTQKNYFIKSDILYVITDQNSPDFGTSMRIIEKAVELNKICFVVSLSGISSYLPTIRSKDSETNFEKLRFINAEGDDRELISNCYKEMVSICKVFHDKQLQQQQLVSFNNSSTSIDLVDDVFKSWDTLGMEEQKALKTFFKSKELPVETFANEMEILNNYITKDGPVMPMLVKGPSGSGMSTLLSHWVSNIEQSLPNSCILYHIADIQSSYSIDPVHILRRFLALLHSTDGTFSTDKISSDIIKDFPRLLERACNKHQNGVVIVIDGIDQIANYKESFKWLLDPQPVPVRVIVSVAGSTSSNHHHPKQWNKWFLLALDKLFGAVDTVKLCNLKMSEFDSTTTISYLKSYQQVVQQMMKQQAMLSLLANHLFRDVVFTLLHFPMSNAEFQDIANHLLECTSLEDLFSTGLALLETRHDKELLRLTLSWILLSENGLSLAELLELTSNDDGLLPLTSNDAGLLPLLYDLESCEIVCNVNWIIKFIHRDAKEAASKRYITSRKNTTTPNNINDEEKESNTTNLRLNLANMFFTKFSLNCISYRVADELPQLLCNLGDKEKLLQCLSSPLVLMHLYRRGRSTAVLGYWKTLSKDTANIKEIYIASLENLEESNRKADGEHHHFDEQIAMLYDLLGEFFKDLGQFSMAQNLLETSLELKETHLEPDDNLLRKSYFLLAKLFTQWKKYQTAEVYLKQALVVKEVVGGQQPTVVSILDFLAKLCALQEKAKDAEIYHKNAINLREANLAQFQATRVKAALVECTQLVKRMGESSHVGVDFVSLEDVTAWLVNISFVYFNMKQFQEAAEVLQLALKYLTKDERKQSVSSFQAVGDVMCKLSFVYTTMGQNDKAEGMLEKALHTYFKLNLLEDPNLSVVINSLVDLYKSQKRMDSLERLHRSHCEALKVVYGEDDIRVASVVNELASHLSKMNKHNEAFQLYGRALNVYIIQVSAQDTSISEILANISKLFTEQRQTQKASHFHQLAMDDARTNEQLANELQQYWYT